MLAFGTGLHKQLIKSTAGLGDRIVIAWPGLTSVPYEGLGKGRRIRITADDLATAGGNVDGLKAISTEYSVLTLVVGGIGVSNIMNVVVEERTRDIGIKMALGGEAALHPWAVSDRDDAGYLPRRCRRFAIALTVCAVFPKLGLSQYVGDPVVEDDVGLHRKGAGDGYALRRSLPAALSLAGAGSGTRRYRYDVFAASIAFWI